MKKTVLALDQASVCSGWSIFQDGKLLEYGKITTQSQNIGERLFTIREEVKQLIDKYNPDYVVFEEIQFQNNVYNGVQTFKVLAEVYGMIEELLTELNIPHEAVLAGSWKSTLGIKGKKRDEQKRNAQQYVIDTYGIKPTQDECDSICINTHYHIKNKHDWS